MYNYSIVKADEEHLEGEKYALFRDRLKKDKVDTGILLNRYRITIIFNFNENRTL